MTQLNRIVGSSSRPLLAIAVCWGLAACEPGELRPVPLGLPSGGSHAIPKAPATPAAPMAPPVMAYTEDPEAETEEWEDYVWADNLQQAQKKCKELAESSTEQGRSLVTVVKVKQASKKSVRWVCTFRG
ncbi:MAG TPA: hypothetical protein V6D29_25375 [Leptolyngbyaceae cyanobacterium]